MRVLATNITIEFGPIAAFIIAYAFTDFFTAIEVSMVATALSLIVAYTVQQRFALFPTLAAVMVLTFGALSITFQVPDFFIFQDTLSNAFFATVLGASVVLRRPFLKPMFEHVFAMQDAGWYILTLRWTIFLAVVAVLNELVRVIGTSEQWVYFKLANVTITTAFAFWQFRLSARYRIPEESTALGLRIVDQTLPPHLRT